ncbi:rhodanese-like domain-containing protein [Roseateles sp.]|uniref:rhodanese-like domain-containing protein n=1 Tax=Roseateles sp. TaxID=1971397 RepID=UPI0037CC68B4
MNTSSTVSIAGVARCVAMLSAGLLLASASSHAQTSVLVNPGDQGEQSRYAAYGEWKTALESALRRERVAAPKLVQSNDATADLATTRSRLHELYVAPAHVIGSAVRYGYQPVAGLEPPVQAVLVAPQSSPINGLADAAGKRLGLPMQDSIVTYLVRGEVNAANSTIKRHFSAVFESRYQDALLVCLQIRRCDVVAVERVVYERWVAGGEALKLVMQSKAVPGLSVALKPGSTLSPEGLRSALVGGAGVGGQRLTALAPGAFDYVATLGYFTPRSLPGASVVDAAAVQQLLQGGAHYIDTRTEAEFKSGHVAGAKLVPYIEKSAKDADYKADDDQFDLSKLPADKSAALVFACNGAECWKSFKASRAALKAGYAKVHWFRGGFPEWRAAGLPAKTQP